MDGARDFDLLGESVAQVRVSARTLALWDFSTLIYFDSLLPCDYTLFLSSLIIIGAPFAEMLHVLQATAAAAI